jgi:flagellar hook protein FlgE
MLRSLFSGISGLRAHQTMLDVTGNNIANVNTTGYKSASTVFSDTLSQLLKAAGSPTATTGGVNPAQVGLGVQVAGITNNFTQGSSQTTGVSTDLMIQGDGFFVVQDGAQTLYTRAGAFTFDSNGNLVNSAGMMVQGYPAVTGVVNSTAALQTVNVPATTTMAPAASSTVTLSGNITSGTTTTLTKTATIYDKAGVADTVTMNFAWNGTTYDVTVADSATTPGTPVAGVLAFLADGTLNVATTVNPTITLTDGTVVTCDLAGITAYGGSQTLAVTQTDGYSSGTLSSLQIANTGDVVGVFSNGQRLTLARVGLATFNNPAGLEKAGDTAFAQTNNSGLANISSPGNGSGTLLGGALEMSNVDLGKEFTNLIIAQRGFQANSKVISTSDQILEELVNMKR